MSFPMRFHSVADYIGELPDVLSPSTVDSNLNFMRELGKPSSIVPLLREIGETDAILHEVARHSYMHVDHFHKIVLVGADSVNGYRLTLHMWIPPYADDHTYGEAIHNHRFSFWSHILVGELASEKYQRSGSGACFREYRYTPTQRGADFKDHYDFVGEQHLVCSQPGSKLAGQTYFMASENIHRVLPPIENMTCTLVLRGPRERAFSNVFNTAFPAEDTSVANVMFSPDYVREKLRNLANTIQ